MKRQVMIIALMIAVMAAFYPIPRANAEPLTIMAIVGIAAVLSASSVDMVASHHEDNRDQRAQDENSEKMIAKAEKSAEASGSSEAEVAVQR